MANDDATYLADLEDRIRRLESRSPSSSGAAGEVIAAFAYSSISPIDGINTESSFSPTWAMGLRETFAAGEAHETGGWTFSNQTSESTDWDGRAISLVPPNDGWFIFGGEAILSLYFDATPTTLRYLDFRINAYCEPAEGGTKYVKAVERRWVDPTEIAAHHGPYRDIGNLTSKVYFPPGADWKRFWLDVTPNSDFDASGEGPTDINFNTGGKMWARS